jgi:hypothetical protein
MRIENLRSGCCLAVFLAALLVGCGESTAPAAVTTDEPWLAPPPAVNAAPEILPANAHALVAAGHIAEAEGFLTAESISQISPGEVSYFAGRPITLPDVSRPYLVRGLYRSEATFTVSIIGNALWVASADTAGDIAPLRHQPLVLIMDEVPETVYVTAGPTP